MNIRMSIIERHLWFILIRCPYIFFGYAST
jgi:hypothetical protein